MRHFLFEQGDAPATAIFYTLEKPSLRSTVFYGAPKLTPLTQRLAAIIIEANDLKQIPTWQILAGLDNLGKRDLRLIDQEMLFSEEDDQSGEEILKHYINIWKPALWGTNHDYTLLQGLNDYPTLEEVEDYLGWFGPHGGFNRTGPKDPKYFPWLDKALFLRAEDFTPYRRLTKIYYKLCQKALAIIEVQILACSKLLLSCLREGKCNADCGQPSLILISPIQLLFQVSQDPQKIVIC